MGKRERISVFREVGTLKTLRTLKCVKKGREKKKKKKENSFFQPCARFELEPLDFVVNTTIMLR